MVGMKDSKWDTRLSCLVWLLNAQEVQMCQNGCVFNQILIYVYLIFDLGRCHKIWNPQTNYTFYFILQIGPNMWIGGLFFKCKLLGFIVYPSIFSPSPCCFRGFTRSTVDVCWELCLPLILELINHLIVYSN
jgi:hypothetical protein